ncbi:hypothetical protein TWF718_002313 [Orbilia javanica]|uniref:Uncharacterized protein n=1 Tax=Orbilia javanica TaxID=47235 RepID=A0AAN8R9T2_9PEZI
MLVLPKMPPSRNSTLRTERTHEENQERAYIAASHRADRSLEARMESARRASEIHKQRTGKFFRVTEKAVLEGEVYDDDEEDIPPPYYQLEQHLKPDASNPEEFFTKFVEYLSTNAFLRCKLESAVEEAKKLGASNAATAQRRISATGSLGFREGPSLEQSHSFSIQSSPFLPTVFVPPYQGPSSSNTPESSNPSTPQTPHPQVTMTQFQTPISTSGAQFYMGPVGLGTLPPHYYQGTYLGRRQTAPTIRVSQQTSAPSTAAVTASLPQSPYYSTVLTPEQYQSMSQNIASRRPSASAIDIAGSPMSDISMASFRTAPNVKAFSSGTGSPEPLPMRRPSAPGRISESPLRTSTFSPHLKKQQQFPIDSESTLANSNLGVRRQNLHLKTQDVNSPTLLGATGTPREGSNSIPPSPALKRPASTDLTEEPSTKSPRTDSSPATTSYSPAQNQNPQSSVTDSEIDLFDFSLPQNIKDILYGPGMLMSADGSLTCAIGQDLGDKHAPTTCTTETPGITMPSYNFSDLELDLSDSLLDRNSTSNPTVTFNMNFSKYDSLDPSENLEDLWRKYFLQRGIQPHTANTGEPTGRT